VGTVNLMPRRADDQVHFPHIDEGKHWLAFEDDCSNLKVCDDAYRCGMDGTREIAANAKALYEQWIKPSDYVTNTNLLKLILQEIEDKAT